MQMQIGALRRNLDRKELEKILPHRAPMLMVDSISEYDKTYAVGTYHVPKKTFWTKGHFPKHPVMPGVLQIEALAQVGCFIIAANINGTENKNLIGFFTTIEKIKFKKMVFPGDTLTLRVELISNKLNMYKFKGVAFIGDDIAAESTFTAMVRETE